MRSVVNKQPADKKVTYGGGNSPKTSVTVKSQPGVTKPVGGNK